MRPCVEALARFHALGGDACRGIAEVFDGGVGIVAAFRDWICRHAGDRELQGVGAMAVLVEHDATGWAYSQRCARLRITGGGKERGDGSVPPSRLLVSVMTHPRVGIMPCPIRGCVIVLRRHNMLGKHEMAEMTVGSS